MSIGSNPVQVESLEVNEADDGLIVYDPSSDQVHHLNPTASVIFDLCDGTRDTDAIASTLAKVYSLQTPPIPDAIAGLSDLAERGLVRWDAHGPPAV